MASMRLTSFLTSPSKVAGALDWKKLSASLLTLDIRGDRIGLTLASHPSSAEEEPSLELASIPLRFVTNDQNKRRCLHSNTLSQLQDVVQTHNVCGFIVNWPLQKEGRMGASCGRVLHTLDAIISDSSEKPILSKHRQFCLWDGQHVQVEQGDSFGRCSVYGRPSTFEEDFVHVASREQYNQRRAPVDLWHDFAQCHWPELCQEEVSTRESDVYSYEAAAVLEEDVESEGVYLQASAL